MKNHSLRAGSEGLPATYGRFVLGRNVQSSRGQAAFLPVLFRRAVIHEGRGSQVIAGGAKFRRQPGTSDAMPKGQLTGTCSHSIAREVPT